MGIRIDAVAFTGAVSTYACLESYSVHKTDGYIKATFALYLDEAARRAGLAPMDQISIHFDRSEIIGEPTSATLYAAAKLRDQRLVGEDLFENGSDATADREIVYSRLAEIASAS